MSGKDGRWYPRRPRRLHARTPGFVRAGPGLLGLRPLEVWVQLGAPRAGAAKDECGLLVTPAETIDAIHRIDSK